MSEGKVEHDDSLLDNGHVLFVRRGKKWGISTTSLRIGKSKHPEALSVKPEIVDIKFKMEIDRINGLMPDDEKLVIDTIFSDDPRYINIDVLAWLVSRWHEQCFSSVRQEEHVRFLDEILMGDETRGICVAWSGGWIGSATLAKQDHLGSGTEQLYIHEVCKAGYDQGVVSPIQKIFEIFFAYAQTLSYIKRDKQKKYTDIHLLVEKKPEHGFGASLNSLYRDRYGFRMDDRMGDSDYSLMRLDLKKQPSPKTEEELLIEQISRDYRAHIKTLKKDDPPGDAVKELQEQYMKIIADKGWGEKPKTRRKKPKTRRKKPKTRRKK